MMTTKNKSRIGKNLPIENADTDTDKNRTLRRRKKIEKAYVHHLIPDAIRQIE